MSFNNVQFCHRIVYICQAYHYRGEAPATSGSGIVTWTAELVPVQVLVTVYHCVTVHSLYAVSINVGTLQLVMSCCAARVSEIR